MSPTWHIITGEYPPQPGGVSDYAGLLAAGLGQAGLDVHVWAPAADGATPNAANVAVHRCAGTWSASDLLRIGCALDSLAPPRHLIVQYTPNAWGRRGLNLAFCRWIKRRRGAGDDVRLMVHEPFYPWRLLDRPQRWLLAGVQRLMMRMALRASARVYLSTRSWEPMLQPMLRPYRNTRAQPMTWLPVPSTIPVFAAPDTIRALRQALAPDGGVVLGSFGTFAPLIRAMLHRVLPGLLVSREDRVCLLLGRGSEHFATEILQRHPRLAGRVVARGGVAAEELSAHLQACDVLVQPYPDGATSRRTSLMAALAHGVPTITTLGFLSDPVWKESECVVLVPASDPEGMIQATESLLADRKARARLSAKAREAYRKHFALENTIKELLRS